MSSRSKVFPSHVANVHPLTLGLAAALASIACSSAQSSLDAGCSRQASVSISTPDLVAAVGTPVAYSGLYAFGRKGGVPGGVLSSALHASAIEVNDVAPLSAEARANLDELRCTFSVDTEPRPGGGYDVYLWTVEHCFRPQVTGALTAHFWDAGARTYRAVDVSVPALDRVAALRAETTAANLPDTTRGALLDALSLSHADTSARAVELCKSATDSFLTNDLAYPGYDAATHTVVCGSTIDLARMKATFKETPSAELKALLDAWHGTLQGMKAGLSWYLPFTSLSTTQRALVSTWRARIGALTAARAEADVDFIVDRVNACFPGAPDPLCASAPAIAALPSLAPAFASAQGRTDNVTRRMATITALEDELGSGFSLVDDIPEHPENFQVQTNARLVSDANAAAAALLDPLSTDTLTGFMALPFARLLGPGPAVTLRMFLVPVNGRTLTAVVAAPRARLNLGLRPGDSGSTFNYLGVLPVGTLSTVDGDPTSGGIIQRTLPRKPANTEQARAPLDASNQPTAPHGGAAAPTGGTSTSKSQDAPRTRASTSESATRDGDEGATGQEARADVAMTCLTR